MKDEILEEISSFSPSAFFSISLDIRYAEELAQLKNLGKSYLLPDMSELLAEESFATVNLAWSEEGIAVQASIDKPFENNRSNDYRMGDNLELFFDTRDIKTTGFTTRFCHHFLLLPDPEESSIASEITQFRTEDTHSLCDSRDLKLETIFHKKSYQLKLFIPSHCLHGYDPSSFDRLGFSYRINRMQGQPQNFSISSHYFSIEQQSGLWSSCKLVT